MWPRLLAGVLAATAPGHAPPGQAVAETPEMTEARANQALMKTPPRLTSGQADDLFPDAARAQGVHGTVTVSGIVGRDGRVTQTVVTGSSRSDLLDATALSAASAARFEPARDAAGNPVAVRLSMDLEFNNGLDGKRGGIGRYACGQFVRDQDWLHAHWPVGQHWNEAIEACRSQPDAMLVDVLKPEGEVLRSLAGRGML